MAEPIEACHQAVGARVRMIRETLGITQAELANRCDGLDRTSIVNIETGRQRLLLQSVEKLARALGTSPKALMKGVWW